MSSKHTTVVASELETDFTSFTVKWIPFSNRFLSLGSSLDGSGNLSIYSLNSSSISLNSSYKYDKSLKCGTFDSHVERNFISGDFGGQISVWDLETSKPFSVFSAHSDLIHSLHGHGKEILSGSRDGTIKLWDLRLGGDTPVTTMRPKDGETSREAWTVSLGNLVEDGGVAVGGFDNGDLKIFDLKANKLLWETSCSNGIVSSEFDRSDIIMNKLVISLLSGTFVIFDLRTFHSSQGFASLTTSLKSKSTLWSVNHLPQNRDVFSLVSGNGSLLLYEYSYPQSRVTKKEKEEEEEGVMGVVTELSNNSLSDQPINSFDWNPHQLGLGIATSFDKKLRVLITTNLNTTI